MVEQSSHPHLRLHSVSLFSRDIDRSLDFYVNLLGFKPVFDHTVENGERFAAVIPPNGSTVLMLTTLSGGADEEALIGKFGRVSFVTEDLEVMFRRWSARGLTFKSAPQSFQSVGHYASFEDPDGNLLVLFGFDEVTKAVEAERRAEAEKIEAERRAAQELEFAMQVQQRLFPQIYPPMQEVDYYGTCIQARKVGGDYYDFLRLGDKRLALVIADISGKGMAAALLMANLQANLRTQSILAAEQPVQLLHSVNQRFYENTISSAYATLFFADFEENTWCLRYLNCGHLPALLLRANGDVEWLYPTATVIGMFQVWNCTLAECRVDRGDLLLLYTDGVTEASNVDGDDFGNVSLTKILERFRDRTAKQIAEAIVAEVKQFAGDNQHDDITLVVAKF